MPIYQQRSVSFEEINNFRNGTYEVIHAVTTGQATEPAHFIMIPKVEKEEETNSWSIHQKKSTELDVVIAIRGSGDPGDFVSDSMLNATAYRAGKAHDGIARSGKHLVNTYIDRIRELWELSGRDKVKITLVGYSLGAGVAAIAAMEFNDYDFISE